METIDVVRAAAELADVQPGIQAAAARLEEARADLQREVDRAREKGATWDTIGAVLKITKQTAWEKFGGSRS